MPTAFAETWRPATTAFRIDSRGAHRQFGFQGLPASDGGAHHDLIEAESTSGDSYGDHLTPLSLRFHEVLAESTSVGAVTRRVSRTYRGFHEVIARVDIPGTPAAVTTTKCLELSRSDRRIAIHGAREYGTRPQEVMLSRFFVRDVQLWQLNSDAFLATPANLSLRGSPTNSRVQPIRQAKPIGSAKQFQQRPFTNLLGKPRLRCQLQSIPDFHERAICMHKPIQVASRLSDL